MTVQRQIDRLIAYQAAEWFERMRCGEELSYSQFVQWICESPRHMEAFLRVASESQAMRLVFERGSFNLETLLKQVSPHVSEFPTARSPHTPVNERRFALQPWHLSLAAGFAAVGVAVFFWLGLSPWQRFQTQIGEQRAVQLAEGSIVNLDAQSSIEVRLNRSKREIYLLRGEAMFKVAHDVARPFIVHTPSAVVQAVGTQFNVYARSNGTTTVSVLEGKVQVSAHTDDSPIPLLRSPITRMAKVKRGSIPTPVAAGEEAKVEATGNVERYSNVNVIDTVAWQQRKLVFKHTPLEDIVADFNRYNKSLPIRLEGIQAGSLRFTGAFDADDPLSLAALLAREPDLSVEKRDGEIVVRARGVAEPQTP